MQNILTDSELLREIEYRLDERQQTLQAMQALNRNLEVVNQKLVDSENLKSNFLSNIRNEINNPLASIMGMANLVANSKNLSPEHVKAAAQSIFGEAFKLDFQLRNIFAAADLESGLVGLEISHVHIKSLLDHLKVQFALPLTEKQITLDIQKSGDTQDDSLFNSDAEKLHLIISNLVDNAIEFTEPNGAVLLNYRCEDGKLSVSVKDNGIGIPPEDHKRIFERFRQLDMGSQKLHKGNGIGLSIVRSVLDLMQGDVAVNSKPGEGCEITIQIPESESVNEIDFFGEAGNEFMFEDAPEEF